MPKKAAVESAAKKARSAAKIAYDRAKEAVEKNDNATTQKALADAKANLDKASQELARDNFKRIGTNRLNKALDAIGLIGNVAQPRSYSYSDADISILEKALGEASQKVIAKFRNSLTAKDKAPASERQSFFS